MSVSISRLKVLDAMSEEETQGLTKKERLQLDRERQKLERSLGGIKNMPGVPDIMFVVDTNKEELAVQEAKKLGIPVIAILDSNSDPDNIDYPIPGNDDASRAVSLYCDLISKSVLEGSQKDKDEIISSDNSESETISDIDKDEGIKAEIEIENNKDKHILIKKSEEIDLDKDKS